MKFQWRGGLPYISWCARKDGWDARWRRGEGADHSGHDGDANYDHNCFNSKLILFCPAYLSISRDQGGGGGGAAILFGNDLCLC